MFTAWFYYLVLVLDALCQDFEVNGGSHVVNVGHEAKLPALLDQFIQKPGVVEGLVEVTVTRRIVPETLSLLLQQPRGEFMSSDQP